MQEYLARDPSKQVTRAQIEERIVGVSYHRLEETVTLCSILLDNGFSVRGESACINPAAFDVRTGRQLAYEQAFDKLWPLFGFLLTEKLYQQDKKGQP